MRRYCARVSLPALAALGVLATAAPGWAACYYFSAKDIERNTQNTKGQGNFALALRHWLS